MQNQDESMSPDHPYYGYFKCVGHHEAAALLYLGESYYALFSEMLEEVKKFNAHMGGQKAPKKTKTESLDRS